MNIINFNQSRLIIGIHGFGGSPKDFKFIEDQNQLSQLKCNTWFPNLYNSEDLGPQISLNDWSFKFNEQLEKINPQCHVTFIGYSMGGRLLMLYLKKFGKNLKFPFKAIIISSHFGLVDTNELNERALWEIKWIDKIQNLNWLDLWSQWNHQKILSSKKFSIPNENQFSREQLCLSIKNWSPTFHSFKFSDFLEIANSCLWICGENDEKYVLHYKSLNIPKKNLRIIPKCGHRILIDEPNYILKLINKFSNPQFDN